MEGVDAAREWNTVPAERGDGGLHALADAGFSGAVTDGTAWALFTNGRVVGVVRGAVDDFADADLTAHEAPDPALPLLLAMRERSGEPRAQYYSEETPLSEVDDRLRQGGFTGYVELSENVLSGDYYVVYYGGDRMPVAFVGNARRVVAGDEAFDRADDEVGIYGVHDVAVEVVDLPAPAGVAEEADAEDGDPAGVTGEADAEDGDPASVADAPAPDPTGDDPTPASGTGDDDESGVTADAGGVADDADSEGPADDAPGTDERAAADPVETTTGGAGAGADDAGDGASADGAVAWTASEDGVLDDPDDGRVERLRSERDEARAERDDLRATVEDLRARLSEVESERDDLRTRVERLRARVEEAGDAGDAGGRALPAAAALSGTNLFVRYQSKASPTLERALDDGAEREAVDENLLLERHTSFEHDGATVDGQAYDAFLESTVEYRFVEWLVRTLPFELRDAAGKRPLGRLYKAMPSFDRAELDGSVTVEGEDGTRELGFDVVVRDRTGAPLAVADVFDGREPVTEAMISELAADARAAAAAHESLGAALFVTTSYYAPEALELAEAETASGGLFGRGARESYVRLDRSHGFHLCLVEARDGGFHLGVPDL